MSNDNTTMNGQTDVWDTVETSQDFNTKLSGKKIIDSGHVDYRKPGETDWFRTFGSSIKDLQKGLTVKVNVDNIDQIFLVLGPEDFKTEIVNAFKKSQLMYLAAYTTSTGRLGVWPCIVPEPNSYGQISTYTQTSFQILERSQKQWVQMKTNLGDRVYDGWAADAEDQEAFGEPNFPIEYKEIIKKAFNDRVITPDNFKDNPYVMRVIKATRIQTTITEGEE